MVIIVVVVAVMRGIVYGSTSVAMLWVLGVVVGSIVRIVVLAVSHLI